MNLRDQHVEGEINLVMSIRIGIGKGISIGIEMYIF